MTNHQHPKPQRRIGEEAPGAPTPAPTPAPNATELAEQVHATETAKLSEVEILQRALAETNARLVTAQATAERTLLESTLPMSFPNEADDGLAARTGYVDSDRVIVLHGYGRVEAERVEGKMGRSNAMYKSVGGVIRDVAFADAVYWRQQWGKQFVKILPLDATEADFARASGIQPMNLNKFAVQAEAVDLDALLEAWGDERALRFAGRIAEKIAAKQQRAGAAAR